MKIEVIDGKTILFPVKNGNLVMTGYSTEKDLKKARKDIDRLMVIMSDMTFFEINKMLEPYRARVAREFDKELRMQLCAEHISDNT